MRFNLRWFHCVMHTHCPTSAFAALNWFYNFVEWVSPALVDAFNYFLFLSITIWWDHNILERTSYQPFLTYACLTSIILSEIIENHGVPNYYSLKVCISLYLGGLDRFNVNHCKSCCLDRLPSTAPSPIPLQILGFSVKFLSCQNPHTIT